MKRIAHDAEYNEAIDVAVSDFLRPDGLEMKEKCPYIFSSNFADAYWITAYSLYHNGHTPRLLHKSRGNKWIADIYGMGTVTVEVMKADQRAGLKFH